MKLWLRSGIKTHLPDGCSMSIIFNGIYRAMQNLGYDVVLTNPGEKCCELWWPYWETEKSDNFLIGYTGGDVPLTEPALQGWEKLDVLFVVNTYYQKILASERNQPPIYAWRHGVAPGRFPAVSDAITGIENTPFVFIHTAFQSARKGGQYVCEAFSQSFSDEAVRLEIINVTADEPFFIEMREKWQHPKIQFTAIHRYNSQMYRNYHGHCFVYPSLYESWGLCVTEAMCSGMPCILSRLPTFNDQFNESCGWWIDMDENEGWGMPNISDLSDKMRYAYEHRRECREKGMYAAQMVRHSLSFEHGILLDFLPALQKHGIIIDRVMEIQSYD